MEVIVIPWFVSLYEEIIHELLASGLSYVQGGQIVQWYNQSIKYFILSKVRVPPSPCSV